MLVGPPEGPERGFVRGKKGAGRSGIGGVVSMIRSATLAGIWGMYHIELVIVESLFLIYCDGGIS